MCPAKEKPKSKAPRKRRKKAKRLTDDEKNRWIGLKDAGKALGLTTMGVLRLRSPTFRIEEWRCSYNRRIKWFVNAADVERERLRRLGPRDYQLEREVIQCMREGRSPIEVMERLPYVTLADLERVQQAHARVIGTIVFDGEQVQLAANLLGIDGLISAAKILTAIRVVCTRVDRLAAELHKPKALPEKAPEEQKPNGEHHEAGDAAGAACS